jgi:glycosyltransferase involved in cell wall biosynthesis
MIYGLPVVGTDVNVIPEMIEPEKNGYIFRRGDSAALAEVLKKLLKNRELREQMMTANRKKAEEIFSYGYFLKNFKEILP